MLHNDHWYPYLLDPEHTEEYEITIAHYLNFLLCACHYLFFGFSCTFATFSECSNEMSTSDNVTYKRNVFGSMGNMLYPTFSWLITKYHCWFTLNILVMGIVSAPNQIIYFINLRRKGMIYMYRGGNKCVYVVARNFFLLLFNCSAWPCLGPA